MVDDNSPAPEIAAGVQYAHPDAATLLLALGGAWTVRGKLPAVSDAIREIDAAPAVRRVTFDTRALGAWDTALLTFLLGVIRHAKGKQLTIDRDGLPQGMSGLIDLATAVPPVEGAAEKRSRRSLVTIFGEAAIDFAAGTGRLMAFIGEAAMSFGRLLTGRPARFRHSDLWLFIEQAGVDALPIVSLLSLLQGLTMAFLGAAQLQMFGAQIYVANLIGMSMAAEVGAVMTAIIMAGRTGAAYAAQIGTMQVNQEIDALRTMGLEPMDFLVLPRMLALILMMPLLYLYANLLGMFGGGVIAVLVLGITPEQFVNQLFAAVPLSVFVTGLCKSAVFGLLVALSGCMQGVNCGRSAAAVGDATTSAVVMAIVAIIVGDGIFGVLAPPFPVGQ
ncbi:ABC transporter permease [Defluviicoccus vanus]|uniref:ABC transporter permease n=1 Tax=Defluviicoccus vanus TaxID=111831 RepID=UPI001CBA6637|nr:ABC transporter permease [Defluviicoccus vanus]